MKKRLLLSLLTVWVALTFTFILVRQMPGDFLHTLALQLQNTHGLAYAQAREMAKLQICYDPDEPILKQYFHYLSNLAQGELGRSTTYRIPVLDILLSALPWTVFITFLAAGFSFVVGTTLGFWTAWRRGSWLDPALTFYATLTQAIPDFLLGVMLLLVLGVQLQWLPLRGAYSPETEPGLNLPFLASLLQHAVLPVLAFSIPAVGSWALSAKATATSVLGEDYLLVARAKGLKSWRILRDYLGRNAIIPLISNLATSLGALLGGSMLIETLFGFPGLGYFLAQSIGTRDYPLMQGLFLLSTLAIVAGNLAAEILSHQLDPRSRR
ncbi:MAG: ABC transporter permease [Candidatus Eremiobacteraeota bacterium]|nr:ABC transporter permease [Candidatus Eremiobacteraeota bacterium]MCW5867797.1 ABC transporter permease [Candidatus Eremiobacteraeota bacterium]